MALSVKTVACGYTKNQSGIDLSRVLCSRGLSCPVRGVFTPCANGVPSSTDTLTPVSLSGASIPTGDSDVAELRQRLRIDHKVSDSPALDHVVKHVL